MPRRNDPPVKDGDIGALEPSVRGDPATVCSSAGYGCVDKMDFGSGIQVRNGIGSAKHDSCNTNAGKPPICDKASLDSWPHKDKQRTTNRLDESSDSSA